MWITVPETVLWNLAKFSVVLMKSDSHDMSTKKQ